MDANKHLEKAIQHLLLAIKTDDQNNKTQTLYLALSYLAQAFYLTHGNVNQTIRDILKDNNYPKEILPDIDHD